MSLTNIISIEQVKTEKESQEKLCLDLRQAIRVINAEYQLIDWEDQDFLNRVLSDALETFEKKGGYLCQ
jgi:hypothetical protein